MSIVRVVFVARAVSTLFARCSSENEGNRTCLHTQASKTGGFEDTLGPESSTLVWNVASCLLVVLTLPAETNSPDSGCGSRPLQAASTSVSTVALAAEGEALAATPLSNQLLYQSNLLQHCQRLRSRPHHRRRLPAELPPPQQRLRSRPRLPQQQQLELLLPMATLPTSAHPTAQVRRLQQSWK